MAVTANGRVYFGTTPISPADLAEKVKSGLSGHTGKKLYIKGDSRTPYAGMAKVLDAVRMAGIEAPNLLTAQRDSPEPGKLLPPKGLEVLVGPSLPSASESIVVQVLNAGQRPTLSINNERISLDALQATLRQLLQNRSQKMVVLRADELIAVWGCRARNRRVPLGGSQGLSGHGWNVKAALWDRPLCIVPRACTLAPRRKPALLLLLLRLGRLEFLHVREGLLEVLHRFRVHFVDRGLARALGEATGALPGNQHPLNPLPVIGSDGRLKHGGS